MRITSLLALSTLAALPLAAQGTKPAATVAQAVAAKAPASAPVDKSLTTTWTIDPTHSRLSFRVRHLVGKVEGDFTSWTAVIRTNGAEWTRGAADVQVKTATISTRNDKRDADLRSPRFFDVQKYPAMTFTSTGLLKTDDVIEMGGLLTIKGITKQVTLRGLFLGRGKGADGKERMGFEASTVIKRKDFGLTYDDKIDGLPIVGDEATITIQFEAVKSN